MKKKYRIREKSLAWYIVETPVGIMALVLTILVVLSVASATAETNDLSGENTVGNQVVNMTEKVAEKGEKTAQTTFYDVPLDHKLQTHIINLCVEYDVDPALVMAVIGQESNYDANAIGDSGKSFGLMQVQKRFHEARMDKLGADDLLDPYDNVTVGIDILAEKVHADKGLEWALMAYNGGNSYANDMKAIGDVSEYTVSVIKLYEELKGV